MHDKELEESIFVFQKGLKNENFSRSVGAKKIGLPKWKAYYSISQMEITFQMLF